MDYIRKTLEKLCDDTALQEQYENEIEDKEDCTYNEYLIQVFVYLLHKNIPIHILISKIPKKYEHLKKKLIRLYSRRLKINWTLLNIPYKNSLIENKKTDQIFREYSFLHQPERF